MTALGSKRLAAVVDVLPAEHVGLVYDRQRLVEGTGVELGALQVAVDHEGGAAALADGGGDHRGAGDDIAGGEDVRHGSLQGAGVGLQRVVAVGLEPERRGVGAHAGGDDDDVAREVLALSLVVLGVEAAVGVEHAGADLELGALHAAVAGEVVDAPAVVQRDALGAGFFDLEVVGRHLLAALQAGLVDRGRAEAASRARRVDGDVAAADHEHTLAGQLDGFAELDGAQELERALHALELLARHAQTHGLVRARGHQHGVEAVVRERRDVVDASIGRDLDADGGDVARRRRRRRRSAGGTPGCRG